MKKIRIGLLGYGTVARGLDEILRDNASWIGEQLFRKTGRKYDISIDKVLVRDGDKYGDVLGDRMVLDLDKILDDGDIDIVCELIGGYEDARKMILKSMEAGKHVVTANKMALFLSGGDLERAAVKNKVHLRYEASVAGLIPIVRSIEESLIGDRFLGIEGILNGSTNYLLSGLEEARSYDEVLKEAKDLGYLEADPSSDLRGEDPLYKLGILSYLLSGIYPSMEDIYLQGIENIGEEDFSRLEEGQTIKLLASMKKVDGDWSWSVAPRIIDKSSPFFSIGSNKNAILLRSDYGGDLFFSGAGAGSYETGLAVLGDIVSIARII